MNIIRKYNLDKTEITAVGLQKLLTSRLWVGFKQDNNGICYLKQYSVNNVSMIYYNIPLATDEITKIYFFGDRAYITLKDTTNIALYFTITTPLTQTFRIIPTGINEAVLDIIHDSSYLYFLLPGEGTENAKILKYNSTLILQEIIELTDIHNVRSFTIDEDGIIWCTTYEENSRLIKVYNDGGYSFEVINLFQ